MLSKAIQAELVTLQGSQRANFIGSYLIVRNMCQMQIEDNMNSHQKQKTHTVYDSPIFYSLYFPSSVHKG